jgi:hypothetical protein
MTTRKTFAGSPSRPAKPGPPRTSDDTKRTFDMRPKPSDYTRREDPRDRAIRPTEPKPEKLPDDPAE